MKLGTFTKQNDTYTGTVTTIHTQFKASFIPVDAKTSDKAPDFKVLASNGAEIGGAWAMVSKSGNAYLSVIIDDVSFPGAINCRLVQSNGEYALVLNR